jgi:hypothetical protein
MPWPARPMRSFDLSALSSTSLCSGSAVFRYDPCAQKSATSRRTALPHFERSRAAVELMKILSAKRVDQRGFLSPLWSVTILLIWVSVAPRVHAAADAPITLSAEPTSISVSRLDDLPAVEIAVIARSTAAKKIPAGSAIYAIAPPGFAVRITPGLPTGSDVVWVATVSAAPTAPDSGTIEFALAGDSAAPLRTRLDVKVSPGQGASPADDLDLTVKASTEGISDQIAGSVLLVMKNKSAEPLRVDTVQFSGPADLVAEPDKWNVSLGPHEVRVTPVTVSFANSRQPMGSYPVFVSARVARLHGSWMTNGTATAEFTATSDVPGVNEALKLLNIPTILLIPGALILSIWAFPYAKGQTQPPWLDWKSSTFWVVAITLSIIVFGALGVGKRVTGWKVNFLAGYNITDIAYLWIGCVVFSATSYGAYRASIWAITERIRRTTEPFRTDSPIRFLEKLARRSFSQRLPRYSGATALPAAIFQTPFPAPAGSAWFIPEILVSATGGDNTYVDAVFQANNKPDQLDNIIRILSRGLARSEVKVEWKPGGLDRPTLQPARPVDEGVQPWSPIVFS